MKIEIIRYTGETEEKEITTRQPKKVIIPEEDMEDVTTTVEIPLFEVAEVYNCNEGEEESVLSRARTTAEIWTRDKEGEFVARVKE